MDFISYVMAGFGIMLGAAAFYMLLVFFLVIVVGLFVWHNFNKINRK